MVQTIDFQRISHSGLIRTASSQEVSLSPESYRLVRVLMQERHEASPRVARELSAPIKATPLFWIFESGFIECLPWDLDEWHW
jgi:hypothetical protein